MANTDYDPHELVNGNLVLWDDETGSPYPRGVDFWTSKRLSDVNTQLETHGWIIHNADEEDSCYPEFSATPIVKKGGRPRGIKSRYRIFRISTSPAGIKMLKEYRDERRAAGDDI